MLSTNKSSEPLNEINLIINRIAHELINEFGKCKDEAMNLIKRSEVEESLMEDSMGFHETAYNWAISILTDHNDHEALEKYLYH
ncbi:hypothetical protein CIL05_17050 [Virgibacillus profundi]|uniref:Uncharacterized protein n=1 Tax=Virgibacillus profundi TaxID=2024555 RepID=A0A2A2I9U3_9BACI|nr:hypothetical protein [Virgibacillus profundi]PAV28342.1 hypothetical protein CIL05_17050 [Virgibacillus profundi]PXY52296.1 hypothetical protein CIT14_18725 [Virgibacillus profundi]